MTQAMPRSAVAVLLWASPLFAQNAPHGESTPDARDIANIDDRPLGNCTHLDPEKLLELEKEAPGRATCWVNCEVQNRCGSLGCRAAEEELDREKGAPGYCRTCRNARDCGGRACNDGICSLWPEPIPPEPVYPRFFLLTIDATLNAADNEQTRVIPGVGVLFQGGLSNVRPMTLDDGGWLTTDLPRWYFNVGASASVASDAVQQILADIGLTLYMPVPAIAMTSLSAGPIYQRRGSTVWEIQNTGRNVDRLGGSIMAGFLYNLFFRVAYLARVRGAEAGGSLIISAVYMHDLVDELVPDRFKKLIPAEFR